MPKHIVSLLALALSFAASAQTLARPGWAGSGLNVEPWWTHAVVYEVDPHRFTGEGLKGATGKLDYIHSLGVDAIALSHLAPDAPASQVGLDAGLGTLEELDDLVREASRSGIRILVELDPAAPDAAKVARFWLGHGIGGVSLRLAPAATIQAVREAAKSFAGQRVVMAEAAPEEAIAAHHGDSLALTVLPGRMDATVLRPLLTRLSATEGQRPVVAMDTPADAPDASRAIGTLLLATHSNAQLRFGQEVDLPGEVTMTWGDAAKPARPGVVEVAGEEADPDSVLNWYRRLIDLHHGNGVFRAGSVDFLNRDAQNSLVWVMRKAQVTPLAPAVVVVCNLSDKPVTLSLADDLHALHLRGSFLRTLARSDKGLGGVSLNAVTLQPYGVYIGELRF